MIVLFVLFSVTLVAGAPGPEPYNCDGHADYTRFFSKFGTPADSVVVIGGYLPNITAGWYCKNDIVTHSGVNGVFLRYKNTGQGFVIGVSQETFDANKYQFFLFRPTNGHQNAKARLRICKWPAPVNLTTSLGSSTATNCLVNTEIPFSLQDNQNIVVGMTWSGDSITVFADKIYHYFIPNSGWSLVRSTCLHTASCAMQFPSNIIYYTLNVTGSSMQYSLCDSPDCHGLQTNVFAVQPGGYIPETFGFNNWFLLTNTSTLVNGLVVSRQPMLVSCLMPVPNFQSGSLTFRFNQTADGNCNGATNNLTPDAFRFNINDTESLVAANSVVLTTAAGYTITLVCSNSSDPLTASDFFIPFGATDTVYYCFLNVSYGGNYTLEFLSVLPPSVREFVITKYGSIYINGYGYVHAGALDSVEVNIRNADNIYGVWTIAATTFTDVLVEVNGTNIVRMLYCDTPERRLMCSQLSFDLDDGFYAITPESSFYVEPKQAFVQLPTFNNHGDLVFNINVTFGDYVNSDISSYYVAFNGGKAACVSTSQFTFKIVTDFKPANAYHQLIFQSKCPFTPWSLNNYLSFGKLCVSNETLADSCQVEVFVQRSSNTRYVTTLFFESAPGDVVTGVPKALGGITDVSFFEEGVCTKYTIYGHKGQGQIVSSNLTYLAGLYYTSPSGQLLAFKNITTGAVFSVLPCTFSQQAAFIEGTIVGVISSVNETHSYNHTVDLPGFYYHSNDSSNCTDPVLVYSNLGVCKSGSIGLVAPQRSAAKVQPMSQGNVSIPTNLTMQIRTEYIQLFNRPVSIDCAMYVCNGNERCNQLLAQYASACRNIENSLQLGARLESIEVNDMLTVSEQALQFGTVDSFDGGDYNFTNLLGASTYSRSVIEDILFDKVVTNGLGTVDDDYKKCSNGLSIADLTCAQFYNGIMVLPGVADAERVHMYSASLMGGMVLGGVTSAAALPFSYAVQARLNYVALQTDVLQRNQQMLAESFNNAIGNITLAFESVNDAISNTAQGLNTVAQALNKVQSVVNEQGLALNHLTKQLQNNFQAISSSIEDIYGRLDQLTADAQVDRLITGRLAAANAFVTQTMTKYVEVQASRRLAQQKVNECVKSQSMRYGFCGDDGEHIFSVVQSAPQGLMFLHTVLVPSGYVNVLAVGGICVGDDKGFTLREAGSVMFLAEDGNYFLSPRKMFEPRTISVADLIQVQTCAVNYVNITSEQLPDVVPDYVDVNKTLEEILANLPNRTQPDISLDIFNATYLNLTGEIADLEKRAESLHQTSEELRQLINNINSTLVDLEWLNRVETYIKWPWWVWLIIVIALIFVVSLLVFCCIATGCCGCCGCCGVCFSGCCKSPRLQPYEPIEKVHIQ
uniref:Spike protein n=1 Tax=Bat Coronavirus MaJX20 TaxID=3018845 RepID=A0AA49EAX1_9NIDO|nr:spike protein [Bat Coronavirus MaJX20]